MPSYQDSLANKNYMSNVLVSLLSKFYGIRQPDSGLDLPYPRAQSVGAITLSSTEIDPKSVTTAIASYSFKLTDIDGAISRVVQDRGLAVVGQPVDVYLGRSSASMDFSDYYRMPRTRVTGISKSDSGYTFSTSETTDRINVPIYDELLHLSGDILAATTVIGVLEDIGDFPSAGTFSLESELITYTSKDNATKTFFGCGRGAFESVPADHDYNKEIYPAFTFSAVNPITILLQLLLSGSGTSAYDVLPFGLGISTDDIDVASIEAVRDTFFASAQFTLALYNEDSALQWLEDQVLAPCNVRFSYSRSNGKLTIVALDQPVFVVEDDLVTHDTITDTPKLEISSQNIANKITIHWDYTEEDASYRQTTVYTDDDSIATYGLCTSPLDFSFKGVHDSAFVDKLAGKMLRRLSTPTPIITVKTQVDKSLLNIGDKTQLETTLLANEYGELNFSGVLEILSRSIDESNGAVTLKLGFTSFTGTRLCYIAPSDVLAAVVSSSSATLNAGRGAMWETGWTVLLWDELAHAYTADATNTILSIVGDTLSFSHPWATTLVAGQHRLKFAEYADCVATQRRYCFINPTGQNFAPREKPYTIVAS